MTLKRGVLILMAMVAAALTASYGREPESCALCQRQECPVLVFRIDLENGRRVKTCCPRCGLHYLNSTGQQTKGLWATDYHEGQWIDDSAAGLGLRE